MQLNNALSLGQHHVWKRMAVKWSGVGKGQIALDVCCGSGDLAFLLANAVGPDGKAWRLLCISENNKPRQRLQQNPID